MKTLMRAALAALLFLPTVLFAQTLTFRAETTAGASGTLVPKLTWTTAPAATSCAAAGAWSGARGPSGVVTLPAISTSQSYTLACVWPGTTGSAQLTWEAPTRNTPEPGETESTPYTNPKGFIINYAGTAAGLDAAPQLRSVLQPSAVTATVTDLTAGTYFFCVRAINTSDVQSRCSNVAQKTVTATTGTTVNRTVGILIVRPNPPTNLQ